MAEEQQKKFDISKYVTAQDIVAAITAGVVAYIRNNASVDDQQQPAAGGTPQQDADFDPTIRVDHGRLDITDPNNWKDGGVVNVNGNEIHVFKAPDGSTIRVNPYQLQAAGGDPMKAAMNQFAVKVQNGEVDLDKMFSAGTTVTTQSGMPVTVNAPPGTNAQDAIAQVRRGMTVDPLGAQHTKDAIRLLAMSKGLDANMQNKVASLAVDNPALVKVLQSPTGVSQLNKLWRDYWSSLPSEIGPERTAAVKAGSAALQKSIIALANQFST